MRILLLLLGCLALAAAPAAGELGENELARVGEVAITAPLVEREVQRVRGTRPMEAGALAELRRQALRQLVDRELVLGYLAASGQAASEADVQHEVERLVAALRREGKTLAAYLAARSLAEEELKRGYLWQLSWQAFLEKRLTEQNLQSHFEKHRAQFDGTQVRVAHLLFKLSPTASAAERQQALQQAGNLRAEIGQGKLSFGEAARKHSQAPSAANGGDIGWIGRHEPMPEPFAAAAFALAEGGVSEPVITSFGVHLIRRLETKAGERSFAEVRTEVAAHATQFLFEWCAAQQRPRAKIELREPR